MSAQTEKVTLARIGAAILSGGLMALAFPKVGLTPVGLIGLVPLIWAVRGLGFWQAFWLGLIQGLVNSMGLLYFLTTVMTEYGGLGDALSGGIFLLLALALAIFPALWSGGLATWPGTGLSRTLFALLAWPGLEWVRTWMMTGFPWEDVGYLLTPWTTMTQLADLGGVGLASALVVLANMALAEALIKPRQWLPLLVGLLVWGAAWGYGYFRIMEIDDLARNAAHVRVRVVQSNIDQNVKWSPAFVSESLDIHIRLSREKSGKPPRLIVWPETAAPFYVDAMPDQTLKLKTLARRTKAWLLFGAPALVREDGRKKFYNRAYLISPQGSLAGWFDKAHLVPYGEYVPLKRYLPFLRTVVEQVGNYSAGEPGRVLKTDFAKLGVLICYETIFPDLARAHVAHGAGLLINMTNDSWFGNSSAPYQHLSMLRWRALETRRAVARSAQNGISALIDPAGRVVDALGLDIRGQLTGDLPILTEKTIYLGGGWLFSPVCLFLCLFAWLVSRLWVSRGRATSNKRW